MKQLKPAVSVTLTHGNQNVDATRMKTVLNDVSVSLRRNLPKGQVTTKKQHSKADAAVDCVSSHSSLDLLVANSLAESFNLQSVLTGQKTQEAADEGESQSSISEKVVLSAKPEEQLSACNNLQEQQAQRAQEILQALQQSPEILQDQNMMMQVIQQLFVTYQPALSAKGVPNMANCAALAKLSSLSSQSQSSAGDNTSNTKFAAANVIPTQLDASVIVNSGDVAQDYLEKRSLIRSNANSTKAGLGVKLGVTLAAKNTAKYGNSAIIAAKDKVIGKNKEALNTSLQTWQAANLELNLESGGRYALAISNAKELLSSYISAYEQAQTTFTSLLSTHKLMGANMIAEQGKVLANKNDLAEPSTAINLASNSDIPIRGKADTAIKSKATYAKNGSSLFVPQRLSVAKIDEGTENIGLNRNSEMKQRYGSPWLSSNDSDYPRLSQSEKQSEIYVNSASCRLESQKATSLSSQAESFAQYSLQMASAKTLKECMQSAMQQNVDSHFIAQMLRKAQISMPMQALYKAVKSVRNYYFLFMHYEGVSDKTTHSLVNLYHNFYDCQPAHPMVYFPLHGAKCLLHRDEVSNVSDWTLSRILLGQQDDFLESLRTLSYLSQKSSKRFFSFSPRLTQQQSFAYHVEVSGEKYHKWRQQYFHDFSSILKGHELSLMTGKHVFSKLLTTDDDSLQLLNLASRVHKMSPLWLGLAINLINQDGLQQITNNLFNAQRFEELRLGQESDVGSFCNLEHKFFCSLLQEWHDSPVGLALLKHVSLMKRDLWNLYVTPLNDRNAQSFVYAKDLQLLARTLQNKSFNWLPKDPQQSEKILMLLKNCLFKNMTLQQKKMVERLLMLWQQLGVIHGQLASFTLNVVDDFNIVAQRGFGIKGMLNTEQKQLLSVSDNEARMQQWWQFQSQFDSKADLSCMDVNYPSLFTHQDSLLEIESLIDAYVACMLPTMYNSKLEQNEKLSLQKQQSPLYDLTNFKRQDWLELLAQLLIDFTCVELANKVKPQLSLAHWVNVDQAQKLYLDELQKQGLGLVQTQFKAQFPKHDLIQGQETASSLFLDRLQKVTDKQTDYDFNKYGSCCSRSYDQYEGFKQSLIFMQHKEDEAALAGYALRSLALEQNMKFAAGSPLNLALLLRQKGNLPLLFWQEDLLQQAHKYEPLFGISYNSFQSLLFITLFSCGLRPSVVAYYTNVCTSWCYRLTRKYCPLLPQEWRYGLFQRHSHKLSKYLSKGEIKKKQEERAKKRCTRQRQIMKLQQQQQQMPNDNKIDAADFSCLQSDFMQENESLLQAGSCEDLSQDNDHAFKIQFEKDDNEAGISLDVSFIECNSIKDALSKIDVGMLLYSMVDMYFSILQNHDLLYEECCVLRRVSKNSVLFMEQIELLHQCLLPRNHASMIGCWIECTEEQVLVHMRFLQHNLERKINNIKNIVTGGLGIPTKTKSDFDLAKKLAQTKKPNTVNPKKVSREKERKQVQAEAPTKAQIKNAAKKKTKASRHTNIKRSKTPIPNTDQLSITQIRGQSLRKSLVCNNKIIADYEKQELDWLFGDRSSANDVGGKCGSDGGNVGEKDNFTSRRPNFSWNDDDNYGLRKFLLDNMTLEQQKYLEKKNSAPNAKVVAANREKMAKARAAKAKIHKMQKVKSVILNKGCEHKSTIRTTEEIGIEAMCQYAQRLRKDLKLRQTTSLFAKSENADDIAADKDSIKQSQGQLLKTSLQSDLKVSFLEFYVRNLLCLNEQNCCGKKHEISTIGDRNLYVDADVDKSLFTGKKELSKNWGLSTDCLFFGPESMSQKSKSNYSLKNRLLCKNGGYQGAIDFFLASTIYQSFNVLGTELFGQDSHNAYCHKQVKHRVPSFELLLYTLEALEKQEVLCYKCLCGHQSLVFNPYLGRNKLPIQHCWHCQSNFDIVDSKG